MKKIEKTKNIEEITISEIVEYYKPKIGTKINDIILNSFDEASRREINKEVEEQLEERGIKRFTKEYAQARNDILYEELVNQIKQIEKIPEFNGTQYKRLILSLIYVNRPEKMIKNDVKHLRELILSGAPYAAIKTTKAENLYSYEIITTAEEPTELLSIKDDIKKGVIKKSLEEILGINDIYAVVNNNYPQAMVCYILSKKLVELLLDEKKISKEKCKEMIGNNDITEDLNNNKPHDIMNFILSKIPSQYKEDYRKAVAEYLSENLQILDISTLLLNSAARTMLGMKLVKGEKIEGIELKEYLDEANSEKTMQGSIQFLKQIESFIGKEGGYKIENDDGVEIIVVNKDIIKQFLERCTDNDYITDDDIENIHSQVLEGILPEDLDARRIANINVQDLINLSNSYEAKEDDEEKTKMLCCAVELAEYLKDEGLTTNKKLLNLYFDGEINLDFIKNIDMPEITAEEYNQKFKLIYDRILYSFSEEEKKKEEQKLSKLAKLYKHLESKGKIDIDDLITNLISAYGEDYGVEVMYDLYNLKMVSIEKAVEWIGDDILLKLCEEDKLPPTKVRQLFENGKISIDSIANIVNTLSDTSQKLILIGSIFSDDKENWNELVQRCIKIEKGAKEQIENGIERKGKKRPVYTKYVIEAFERMRKISSIDDEYYFERSVLDGHIIIYLPKFQKVIIEKMFDRKGNTAQDAATYRLSKEYFEKNRYRIIEDGKVHRKVLFEDYKRDDVSREDIDRKIHNRETWGRGIDEWFGIESESRWKEDELKDAEEKGKTTKELRKNR